MGMQGAEFGGQLGLQGAVQQGQLQQGQMGLNLSALQQQANQANLLSNINQQGFGNALAQLAATAPAAQSQQGFLQQQADTAYQNQMANLMFPYQATTWGEQMLGMQPLPYSTVGNTVGTTALTQPGPNVLSQIAGLGLGIAGLFAAKGGRVGPNGIMPAPEDEPQHHYVSHGRAMRFGGHPTGVRYGHEPRHFQYGGYEGDLGGGITTPHYPQPIMPGAAPIPDLISHVRMQNPQQQGLFGSITDQLKDKNSAASKVLGPKGAIAKGPIGRFFGSIFHHNQPATDNSNNSTNYSNTDSTSSSTPAPLDVPGPATPPQTAEAPPPVPATPESPSAAQSPTLSSTESGAPNSPSPLPSGESPAVEAYLRQGYPLDQARAMAAITPTLTGPPGNQYLAAPGGTAQAPGTALPIAPGTQMSPAVWSYVRQGYPLDQARQMAAASGPNPFYWDNAPVPTFAQGGIVQHSDAAADRRQVLQILKEKGLTKADGGVIRMKRRHFVPRPKGSLVA
jgi:hypothetical protein